MSETWQEQLKNMKFKDLFLAFDLLNDTNMLEDFLANLSQKERDELYSHPLLENYDLLP